METNFKIIISGKDLYSEFAFPKEQQEVRVGTQVGCDFRLHKDLFFEPVFLSFVRNNGRWSVVCAENLYFSVGDSRRLMNVPLKHGDSLLVKYRDSGSDAFYLEFQIDFDAKPKKYEREISITNLQTIQIGAEATCQICIGSPYVCNDLIELSRTKDGFRLKPVFAAYGIYVNGIKTVDECLLRNRDFFSVSDFVFYLKDDCLWTEIRDDMTISGLKYTDHPNPNEYPKFQRNTRLKSTINKEKIEILDPPAKPQKPKNSIITTLLPSFGMLLVSGAMAMTGNSGMILFSMISGGLAVVTTILGMIQARKEHKQSIAHRLKTYHAYADNKQSEIAGYRKEERDALCRSFIDPEEESALLRSFSGELFDRRPGDEDFLCVRLGYGTVKALRPIEYKKQERLEIEDDLQMIPARLAEEYAYITDAPVVCDLRNANAVGIVGAEASRYCLMKNMVVDLCTRQYQNDLQLFFVAKNENAGKIRWLRFLPHIDNEITAGRNLAYDDETKNRLFDYLYKELSARQQNKDGEKSPHLIVFLYDNCGLHTHPISKFVDQLKELAVTFIFMDSCKEHIPQGCSSLIVLDSPEAGRLVRTADVADATPFTYQGITDTQAQQIVQLLAPVYTEEISLEGTLTKNISLFELLDIFAADDLDLGKRWAASEVYRSMAAPIGVTKSSVISLNLHDKAHGPHGLVAGTTGSGKSEILQTYILSIATLFHPYEVAFVIIDFKGGGMVNQFRKLPHLIGAITNIDGKQIDRSLKSIKAELRKRQQLFADAGVNHIDKYIQKFKAGEVFEPLPHLVLIVDEFAELKAEQPDFMKELISAARIGRSLGVHLILATQKPSGQVDDQIWSNSKFKLCLKVQSPEDSNEVLKAPLAAEIKEPGRAYLQVGNNEIFELFQSAYSGAPEKMADAGVREFSVFQISDAGKRTPIYVQKKHAIEGESLTQLEAIVNYVSDYCSREEIQRLPEICLPALPATLDYPQESCMKDGIVGLGLYDDPDNQIQEEARIDISNRHTLILGSSQYGKTNLLQSFLRSIALSGSAKESTVYILDFGSMVLKNYETLNNVGGVVCSSEDEKLKNLLKLLFAEISERKECLLDAGVSSYASYVEAGYTDLPHIYLFIDNLGAAMELYFDDDDSLLSILREGLAVGISVIVTNAQTSGIGYRYLSNFANKIALRCNDSAEYVNLFDTCPLQPDDITGRCVLELNKRLFECQTYLAFPGEKEIDRVQHMQALIQQANAKHPDVRAKQIPCIPPILTEQSLAEDFDSLPDGYSIPIGLTYTGVEPFSIDLTQLGLIGLCGKDNSGHRNFLRRLFHVLESNPTATPVSAVIFDDFNRKLEPFATSPIVDTYTMNPESVDEILASWHEILSERYDMLMENGTIDEEAPLLLMLIQNNDIAKRIGDDFTMTEQFTDLVTRFKDMKVAVIFTNYQNASLAYDAPEPLRMVKQEQHLLFLDNLDNLKLFDVAYEDLKANTKRLETGDAYYLEENTVTKLKVVLAEDSV